MVSAVDTQKSAALKFKHSDTKAQKHTQKQTNTHVYTERGGNGVKLMSGKDSHLLL